MSVVCFAGQVLENISYARLSFSINVRDNNEERMIKEISILHWYLS